MSQWGKAANTASNSVLWGVRNVRKTANSLNQTAFYGNTTVGAYVDSSDGQPMKEADGQFGVTPSQKSNTGGEGKKVGHSGWNIRKVGVGRVNGAIVVAGGIAFTNTDIVTFGNSTVNAVGTPVTNSTGGILSITVSSSALYANTTGTGASITNSTGGSTGNGILSANASPGGTTYNNTDIITFSNGVINATANPVTNSTGGILSITVNTVGKGFSNNTNTVKAVTNATGGATTGSGATFTVVVGGANLQATLNGRAGRVTYETLVATGSMTGTNANTTILPG